MNELIEKLFDQAKVECFKMGSKPATTVGYDELERFAQLLVQECVSLFDGSREMKTVGLLSHTQVIEQIKEHFGVE